MSLQLKWPTPEHQHQLERTRERAGGGGFPSVTSKGHSSSVLNATTHHRNGEGERSTGSSRFSLSPGVRE